MVRALRSLRAIGEALRAAELSYDKVRALSTVATPGTDIDPATCASTSWDEPMDYSMAVEGWPVLDRYSPL